MKLSTMHILIGAGVIFTGITASAATAFAIKRLDELGPGTTKKDKAKILIPSIAAPVAVATATIIGVKGTYNVSSETIKTVSSGLSSATNVISAMKKPCKKEVGKNKEKEMYEEALVKAKKPSTSNLEPPNGNYICGIINPQFPDERPELYFVSNPTEIEKGLVKLNKVFTKRVHGSDLNNAWCSLEEFYFYMNHDVDSRTLRQLGWDWQLDGPIEVDEFVFGQMEDGKPFCGIILSVPPHPI